MPFVMFLLRIHIVSYSMLLYLHLCAYILGKPDYWVNGLGVLMCGLAGGMLSDFIIYGYKRPTNPDN
jgi:hypothetical protein